MLINVNVNQKVATTVPQNGIHRCAVIVQRIRFQRLV